MTYGEYRDIISSALSKHCTEGGSILNVALNNTNKEYIYEFDKGLPEDTKKILTDRAHQAMSRGEDLPKGIRLVRVDFR